MTDQLLTHFLFPQDLEMMTLWVGGVEEAVALVTEGGPEVEAEAEAEAWDASEMDLLAESRQTSENPLTVSHLFILKKFPLYKCFSQREIIMDPIYSSVHVPAQTSSVQVNHSHKQKMFQFRRLNV